MKPYAIYPICFFFSVLISIPIYDKLKIHLLWILLMVNAILFLGVVLGKLRDYITGNFEKTMEMRNVARILEYGIGHREYLKKEGKKYD